MTDHGHPILARLYDPVMAGAERTVLVEHREYLSTDLSGRVLDLGAGTGALFPYLQGADIEVHAVEPDPHMRARASERAAELEMTVNLVDAEAESLPYDDAAFDFVISSLVFCTVQDPVAGLDEVARVLGDGGEFRFLEHVRGEGLAGRVHDVAAPAWHAAAGGCHLDRRTGALFRDSDLFTTVDYERFEGSLGLMPMLRGRLRRRSASRLGRLVDHANRLLSLD